MQPQPPTTIASLFSGIGGFEKGLHAAGIATRLMCEIDPAARAVLRARFPDVELHEDVTYLRRLPAAVDLVTMGFPCQDLSQVGTRACISGGSSSIIWAALALIRRAPPPALLIENVPFMLQLASGEAIRQITDELRAIGYRWAYRVIDARAFGLPQHRPRRGGTERLLPSLCVRRFRRGNTPLLSLQFGTAGRAAAPRIAGSALSLTPIGAHYPCGEFDQCGWRSRNSMLWLHR